MLVSLLNWETKLDFNNTIDLTNDWYYSFYNNQNLNVLEKCREQIKFFNQLKKFLHPRNLS